MKTSKSAFIALAFVLGIGGAFATKPAHAAKPFAAQWYLFTGTPSQINDPSQYTLTPADPGCIGSADRCAVEALPSATNPNQPDLAHVSKIEQEN
ncbi:DUF6520 family protein [Mucilaginibacter aquaedulcis]|uniref:DUF6520 family protein n=1 Tax=Mucilaginibacter aquaedulcis TaxID=1187081 RepID=UPI0025B34A23|nr:DUF6520 family protein [Mucilaginibacter aquaedulcis]MDN3548914.1 DUF6520 family protein [Mucilaginibacter aquaedulcis]